MTTTTMMTMTMTPSVVSILLCLLQTTTRTTGFRSCPVPLRVAFQHVPIPSSSSLSFSLLSSSSSRLPQFGDSNSDGTRNKRNRRSHPEQAGRSALAAVSNKNNQNTASTLPPETQPSSSSAASSSSSSQSEQQQQQQQQEKEQLTGLLVLLTVPFAWGTYGPVVRYVYALPLPVPGLVFSACYYTVAALTTLAMAAAGRRIVVAQGARGDGDGGVDDDDEDHDAGLLVRAGGELGSYLFVANCLQVLGLRTVEADRAGFLVQLTTIFVPLVEGVVASNLQQVPLRTWWACLLAFLGLLVMGFDGNALQMTMTMNMDRMTIHPWDLFSITQGDTCIIGAALLYTLHVVRLGAYAQQTRPIELAASKATVETMFSLLLVFGLMAVGNRDTATMTMTKDVDTIGGDVRGVVAVAADTGREITAFFTSFTQGVHEGTIPDAALLSAGGAILWTGWITCAYTIFAQSFGQARVSPTKANLIYTFQPIFTALFAYLLLGETMGPTGFLGGGIIAMAVYIVASTSFGNDNNDDNDSKDNGNGKEGENKNDLLLLLNQQNFVEGEELLISSSLSFDYEDDSAIRMIMNNTTTNARMVDNYFDQPLDDMNITIVPEDDFKLSSSFNNSIDTIALPLETISSFVVPAIDRIMGQKNRDGFERTE